MPEQRPQHKTLYWAREYDVSRSSNGPALLNDVQTVKRQVPANGRRVLPYTSPLYLAGGETVGLTCDFNSTITDDRGHSMSVSTQVEITHREHF